MLGDFFSGTVIDYKTERDERAKADAVS